jgi:GNAT superfamily N-acetyltransferase
VLGGVGLAPFDPPEIVGTIVRPDRRGQGIGQRLLAELARWAAAAGHPRLWVATGGRAVVFYQRCGMEIETAAPGRPTILATPPRRRPACRRPRSLRS